MEASPELWLQAGAGLGADMRIFLGIFVFLAAAFVVCPSPALALTEDPLLLEVEAAQLFKAGKIEEAIPFAQRHVEVIEKRYGRNHSLYARALRKLADLYRAKGDYKKAEGLYKQVLRIYQSALGRSHQDSFLSLHGLLETYKKQGRHKEAAALKKHWQAMAVEIAGDIDEGADGVRRGGVRMDRRPASVDPEVDPVAAGEERTEPEIPSEYPDVSEPQKPSENPDFYSKPAPKTVWDRPWWDFLEKDRQERTPC